MVRSFFLLLLLTLISVDAQATSQTLLGRSVEIVIPAGYCIAGAHPAEAEFMRQMSEGIGNSNQMLAFFADCRQLQEFRSGKRKFLDNYGSINAQTPNGQLRLQRGISRSEFIAKLSGQAKYSSESFKKAEARVKQFVPSFRTHENLGVLITDSNGLYMGLLLTYADHAGKPRQIVGVVGMTLVKELSISINLYQAYSDAPALRRLLALQQSAMANFVRAND